MRATSCPPVTISISSSPYDASAVSTNGRRSSVFICVFCLRAATKGPAGSTVQELIRAIRARAKEFGPQLAAQAYSQGLTVTLPDGSTRPIPIAGTPIVVEVERARSAVALSMLLSSAAYNIAGFALSSAYRDLLLG